MRLAALLIAVSAAAPALAQERTPTERQSLLDLSYALGESHALRQACQGADDQYWHQRMVRLTDTEAADEAFDAQLRGRFNTGYAAGNRQLDHHTGTGSGAVSIFRSRSTVFYRYFKRGLSLPA